MRFHEPAPVQIQLTITSAISIALTRWRQLSAFLLNPTRSDRGHVVAKESELEPLAQELVTVLNKSLSVFVDDTNRDDQENHLRDVAVECAKFGYVIFSQPAEFAWKFEADADKEIVVCPGLDKVTDDHGLRCTPDTLAAPEVDRY